MSTKAGLCRVRDYAALVRRGALAWADCQNGTPHSHKASRRLRRLSLAVNRTGLGVESSTRLRAARQQLRQEFERHALPGLHVLGGVDGAHSAAAKLIEDAVAIGQQRPLLDGDSAAEKAATTTSSGGLPRSPDSSPANARCRWTACRSSASSPQPVHHGRALLTRGARTWSRTSRARRLTARTAARFDGSADASSMDA